MTHDPGATGTMILLFSVALATAPAYPSRVLPPAPQVSGPAGGLQGSGRRAAYLHQLAGEEEQGVQCAGEGCQPHLTLGLSCCPAPERDLPPHLAIFTNVNTPPPFCFVNEKENPVTVCLPCPLLPEPTQGAHGPGGHGAGGLGLSWPLGRGPPPGPVSSCAMGMLTEAAPPTPHQLCGFSVGRLWVSAQRREGGG